MKISMPFAIIFCVLAAATAIAADSSKSGTTSGSAKDTPARSAVDPAKASAHAKEDIRRHRIIAAAHEAAARCREAGKDEDYCMAQLGKACQGIAYGKYCGMKDSD